MMLYGEKIMQSTFNTSRIFNDQDGWYVVMRASDDENLLGPKHKIIGLYGICTFIYR